MPRVAPIFRRLAADRRGSVMVELALVMSIFAILVLGGFEVSRMAVEAHQVEQIARAGVQWGFLGQADATDIPAVEAATMAAAVDMVDAITVEATNFCMCPGGVPVDCSEDCDGAINQLFLQVVVTKPYDFIFSLQDTYGTVTLRGVAQLRVR